MSQPQHPYGFRYFDKLNEYDEEPEIQEHEERSCPGNCCDRDCECDDCERCSMKGTSDEETYQGAAG